MSSLSYLLDTDICSAHMRRPSGMSHRFLQYAGRLAIPTIVLAELYAGAHKKSNPQRLQSGIADILQEVTILDFDRRCAEEYGRHYGSQAQQGLTTPNADLMIASVALVHDLTLVTHNTRDYRHVSGLRLEDWLSP